MNFLNNGKVDLAYQLSDVKNTQTHQGVFYIDVGNLPKAKAEQEVKSLMNKYIKKFMILYEDQLPKMSNKDYDIWFNRSWIDIVRIGPALVHKCPDWDFAEIYFTDSKMECCTCYPRNEQTI